VLLGAALLSFFIAATRHGPEAVIAGSVTLVCTSLLIWAMQIKGFRAALEQAWLGLLFGRAAQVELGD
jgi:hypothetical protein